MYFGMKNSVETFFVSRVSFRSDPPEGAGDRRAEAEDRRGDGCHAEPVLLLRRQQPRHPPLLLQVHGQQSLLPGPQRLHLPAPQKVTLFVQQNLIPLSVFCRQFPSGLFLGLLDPDKLFALSTDRTQHLRMDTCTFF